MLRKSIVFFIALCIIAVANAQNLYKADPRLLECISAEYLAEYEQTNPELIAYYNYYLDNSYYVVNLNTAEKPVTGTDIHTIFVRNEINENTRFSEKTYQKEKFNPIKYDFKLSMDSFSTFIWKEAGVAIVFYPLSHISYDFKEYLKNKTK